MDITGIIQVSKELLLEQKSLNPTLFVEVKDKRGKLDNLLIVVDWLEDTTPEKMKQFFGIGRKLGIEHPAKQICQICFAVEAWFSHYKDEIPADRPQPRDDPNRKEMLIVSVLDVIEKRIQQSLYHIEMLRDGSGELVDLLPDDDDPMEVQDNKILMAFMAGYVSARMSDRELAQMAARYSR